MNPKQFFYGLVAVLVVTIVGGLALFVASHRSLGAKVAELETVIADTILARERLSMLEDLENQFEELDEVIQLGEAILPPEKAQAEALAILTELVRTSGLTARSISFERTSGLPTELSQTRASDVENVLVMPVNIQTEPGSYVQLQRLLLAIENNVRHMQVRNLDIVRTSENRLAFSIRVDTYISK